jgi:cyclic pyranopterin phosphate synthase
MSRDEVVSLTRLFTRLGIRQVRLAGGEPLMRRDLETIVAKIAPEVDGRIHLTTNGLRLASRARGLRAAGLAGVTVSLDAAERQAFERLTRKDGLARVLAGIQAARTAGLEARLSALVLRGWNDDQILPLTRLARQEGLELRFVAFSPCQDHGWEAGRHIPAEEILARVQTSLGTELPEEPALDLEEGPVRLFALPGSAGKVGISSTQGGDFCDCGNRVLLTSRGELKACLFATATVDLLGPLRDRATPDALAQLIRQTLRERRDCPPLHYGDQILLPRHLWQVGG